MAHLQVDRLRCGCLDFSHPLVLSTPPCYRNKNDSKSITAIANSQTGREKLSVAFPTLTLPSINEWMDPSKNVVPEA